MHIEVTNLNLSLSEADVRRLFLPYGEVGSVKIIRDKRTNRSQGRAQVIMPVYNEGEKAIISLNGFPLAGKTIKVTEIPSAEEEGFRPGLI
jgi:RNA recognition motif-containing protein